MRLHFKNILSLLVVISSFVSAQTIDCDKWDLNSGADLALYDSQPFSLSMLSADLMSGSSVVFCPAGIERSSPDDIKKRWSFDWTVKYNNVYVETSEGIVIEGMNEHGFSASLMFLDNSELLEKQKRYIPIATSLIVNFFIDHFKSIDTALLAVWDIRPFNDLETTCGWPFRIVLHDSTGAIAYVEYINGQRQVYTPDHPCFIVGGPDYTRLVTLEYLGDTAIKNQAEKLYLDFLQQGFPPNADLVLLQYYMQNYTGEEYYTILRYPKTGELNILLPSGDAANFKFDEIEFIPGKEFSTKYF